MATRYGTDLIQQMNALRVPHGCLAIWGLGQMGVALKGEDGDIFYIDLYLSNGVVDRFGLDIFQRTFPPPLLPQDITNAAYVLCTHEHLDHADPDTLGPLAQASPQARFVISGWAQQPLDEAQITPSRRIVPPGDASIQLGAVRLTAIPAAHYERESDERGERWLSFLLEWDGVRFFHSGDTIIYPGHLERLKALPQADVAMLALNGRDAHRDSQGVTGNLHPREAAWLAQELGWDMLLSGHNDLFAWNAIPAGALSDALQAMHPRQKHHTLQPGELLLYVR